jgi:hypothetical protein
MIYPKRKLSRTVLDIRRYPHGDRNKYKCGCRCSSCRKAATDYARMLFHRRKRGEFNGLVSAWNTYQHLKCLARHSVGARAVAYACDVSSTTIFFILKYPRCRIQNRVARSILKVTPDAIENGATIDAGPTLKLVGRLLEEGFTRKQIAEQALGKSELTLKARITAIRALRIRQFYNRVMA